jgi:hypothetical protein
MIDGEKIPFKSSNLTTMWIVPAGNDLRLQLIHDEIALQAPTVRGRSNPGSDEDD